MTIAQFQKQFEAIVPPSLAWKGDNVGLQIGRQQQRIGNVMIALDLTPDVVAEALRKRVNLIITHHPLLFHPLKRITPDSRVGALVLSLAEHGIAVYAAHTNLDSVRQGVNFALSARLGLHSVRVLAPMSDALVKIIVFVPKGYEETVASAMHAAGAGNFSRYDTCSFRTEGTGTFRGMNDASPFIGTIGTVEKVQEVRLEMLVERWKSDVVIRAMLKAHPYEEAAFDVYPLLNATAEFGLGAIGELKKPFTVDRFLAHVKRRLNARSVRYSGGDRIIKRVAVCGGSGSEYIRDAVAQGADAMVTADLKFHTFQEYEHDLLLVDAGHYETEACVLAPLAGMVKTLLKNGRHTGSVFITKHNTNPVHSS